MERIGKLKEKRITKLWLFWFLSFLGYFQKQKKIKNAFGQIGAISFTSLLSHTRRWVTISLLYTNLFKKLKFFLFIQFYLKYFWNIDKTQ